MTISEPRLFSYVFYISLATLGAILVCSLLGLGYRTLPKERQSGVLRAALAVACASVLVGFPYAGYRQVEVNTGVSERNNRIAAIETQIMRLEFDQKCTFNGYPAATGASSNNSFPCLQRGNIRVVSNPYKGGLAYFVVDAKGTPTRRRGITDYPIPFLFATEHNLLDEDTLRNTFVLDLHG